MKDIPALVVAATVCAYWTRVGVMSYRLRRRTRRLAGVVPQQRLEQGMWLVWVPLVALWMGLPLLAALRDGAPWAVPAFAQAPPVLWLRWLAAVAAVVCLALTLRCWRRMGAAWTMAVTPDRKTDLITDGPFARVRHPIYGYSLMLMACSVVVVATLPMLVVGLVHLVLMIIKARNEERHLLAVHGEAYARYVARTGRFMPRFAAPRD
jgi:protein-S-isoprenylcysteine O-methyltransferase Ste14